MTPEIIHKDLVGGTTRSTGEPALFERVAKGEHAAFQEVHTMYKARLAYYLKKLMEDWQDIEDIVSDTFIALWKRREHIASDLHLKNFLFVTARNNTFNLSASQSRRQKLLGILPTLIFIVTRK